MRGEGRVKKDSLRVFHTGGKTETAAPLQLPFVIENAEIITKRLMNSFKMWLERG